jgi:hypothetical protein
MDPQQDPIVAELAAQALGAEPPAPAAAAPAAAAPAEGEAPTVAEQATAIASPTTEGDISEQDSVIYEVAFGDKKRQLTPQQITSTFDRYANMNHRWQNEVAPMTPVLEFAKKIMMAANQQGQQISPQDLAAFLQEAAMKHSSSFGSNSQGGQQPPGPQGQGILSDDDLAKWEEENAVTLPPGFRENAQKMSKLEQQLAQTNQMLMAVLEKTQGATQAMQQGAQTAQTDRVQALRQTIANNLNMAQQQAQLPDEAEQDFFNFASARGYTIEDFIDPQLTMAVVADFKNNMNSPEMERLRAIAQKRQAYTGSMQSAPGASGAAPAKPNEDQEYLNNLIASSMPPQ